MSDATIWSMYASAQNEMTSVALHFRAAMQAAPSADEEVDALPTISMVALPDELLQHIVRQACNPLEPRVAVYVSSASHGLWALTPALLQQLRADNEVAAALCRKLWKRSCKELREAKMLHFFREGLSSDDLALLGTLGSVLPALETLYLWEPTAGTDGVQRLAERLGAGALPALNMLVINIMLLGDAGASVLAAALGRGASVAHMHAADKEAGHGRQRARAQPLHQPLHAVGAGC